MRWRIRLVSASFRVALAVAILLGALASGAAATDLGSQRTLTVAGLGDSIPDAANCAPCVSYVTLVGKSAAAALGRRTRVVNLSRTADLTSKGLLALVRTDPAFSSTLSSADVVTISIGNNETCAGPDTERCWTRGTALLKRNVAATLGVIRTLRKGAPTAIRVTGLFNQAPGHPDAPATPGFQTYFARKIAGFNAAICAAARTHGAVCVDLLRPFNGPSGRASPKALLMGDYVHPNAAGQRAIAAAIAKTGFAPLH